MTEEQKAAAAKAAEEAKKAAEAKKAEEQKAAAAKNDKKDYNNYQKFAELKFLMWDGQKYNPKHLKDKALKKLESLEEKVRSIKTKNIPKKSKTLYMGVGEKNIRIVAGYAVPNLLFKKLTAEQKGIYF